MTDCARRGIVLKPCSNRWRHVVVDLLSELELEALAGALALDSPIQNWIDRDIPALPLLVDDRTELKSPGIRREGAPLVADFRRETETHRQAPALGCAHARADVVAYPLPCGVRL